MTKNTPPVGDVLLEAHGISKAYEVDTGPAQLFVEHLFGLTPKRELFQALKPLDLTVRRGQSIGILGRNGAGKSTLLGVLSGILTPTTGKVIRHGRIAALIGVGQSFNIEETGEYNAKRFCRLLGLSGEEAREAVSRIEAFAELGHHFRRPVKTYSSGMRSRLNFSCATSIKADLIIVDEVLAVGDAEFRSKCYGHIEASIEAGQTYIMVSHSPATVGNYCDRALVINEGELVFDGDPLGGMQAYQDLLNVGVRKKRSDAELQRLRAAAAGEVYDEALEIVSVRLEGVVSGSSEDDDDKAAGEKVMIPAGASPASVVVRMKVLKSIDKPRIAAAWRNSKGINVAAASAAFPRDVWRPGEVREARLTFTPRLVVGGYLLRFTVGSIDNGEKSLLLEREGLMEMQVVDGYRPGLVDLDFTVTATKLQSADEVAALSESI